MSLDNDKKGLNCVQNTPNQHAVFSHAHNYLIETHDILGCTAKIDRGKNRLLGE